MIHRRNLLLSVLAVALVGCALKVGEAHPRPNVPVVQPLPVTLALGPEVPDTHTIPDTGSVRSVSVSHWHATLSNGFRAAFSPSGSEYALSLDRAELGFVPAAVSGQFGTAAVLAQITFRGTLRKGNEIVLSFAGTAQAKGATASTDGMTDNAGNAVETMYEDIVAKVVPAITQK